MIPPGRRLSAEQRQDNLDDLSPPPRVLDTSPVLGKPPPEPRDYRPMTWWLFLALREWARVVAQVEQARVYLVGSALVKSNPRDVDLSIVLPRDVFEARFGPLPDDPSPEAHRGLWQRIEQAKVPHWINAQKAVEDMVHVDVKFAPDCWWPEKDRLLLAGVEPIAPPDHPAGAEGGQG